jgi:hypothetical protein
MASWSPVSPQPVILDDSVFPLYLEERSAYDIQQFMFQLPRGLSNTKKSIQLSIVWEVWQTSWGAMSCTPIAIHRRFRGKYYLHFQGWRVCWLLARIMFWPWRWKQYVPAKYWTTREHITFQEILSCFSYVVNIDRDNSVGIVAGYRLDGWGSIPGRGKNFLFSTASRPALGPPSLPYNGYGG